MFKLFVRRELSLNEIINFMKPWMDREGQKIILNKEYQKQPIRFTQELLDFKAKWTLEEGYKQYCEWYVDQWQRAKSELS